MKLTFINHFKKYDWGKILLFCLTFRFLLHDYVLCGSEHSPARIDFSFVTIINMVAFYVCAKKGKSNKNLKKDKELFKKEYHCYFTLKLGQYEPQENSKTHLCCLKGSPPQTPTAQTPVQVTPPTHVHVTRALNFLFQVIPTTLSQPFRARPQTPGASLWLCTRPSFLTPAGTPWTL